MTLPPRLPRSRELEAFLAPKSWREWRRFCAAEVPLRDRLADFVDWLEYLAAADLCYAEAGLLGPLAPTARAALEYVASRLRRDAELMGTLWLIRDQLGDRAARWALQERALQLWRRLPQEAPSA